MNDAGNRPKFSRVKWVGRDRGRSLSWQRKRAKRSFGIDSPTLHHILPNSPKL